MSLKEILDSATPGPWEPWEDDLYWKVESVNHGNVANTGRTSWDHSGENARLIALAPELAALVLDMGDILRPLAGRPDALTDKINAVLARLDQLGKEPRS